MNNDTSIYLENIKLKPIAEIKVNKEPWILENPVDILKDIEEIEKICKEKYAEKIAKEREDIKRHEK